MRNPRIPNGHEAVDLACSVLARIQRFCVVMLTEAWSEILS